MREKYDEKTLSIKMFCVINRLRDKPNIYWLCDTAFYSNFNLIKYCKQTKKEIFMSENQS